MPRGPEGLPPDNLFPATTPREPSSWKRATRPTHQDLKIFVPADLNEILLNGQRTFEGKPVTLATLRPGDRLKVHYDYQETSGNVANRVEALRQVELQGVLAEDFDGRLLSVVKDNRQVVKLPFGSQYVIAVNGQPVAKPSSLKRGDRVTVKHDNYITEVVAQRTLAGGGVVRADQLRSQRRSTWLKTTARK